MTTKEVVNLDYRKEENQEIIQRVLRQIKPLSKYSDEYEIPLNALEKAIAVMCKKYAMHVQSIMADTFANEERIIWRAMLISEDGFKIIDAVHGISMYELLAKIAIRLYAEIKKGIKLRN